MRGRPEPQRELKRGRMSGGVSLIMIPMVMWRLPLPRLLPYIPKLVHTDAGVRGRRRSGKAEGTRAMGFVWGR